MMTQTLDSAVADFDGSTLRVTTGTFTRCWRVCPQGLATTRVRLEINGIDLVAAPGNRTPDWQLFTLTDAGNPATLKGVEQEIVSATSFERVHLLITATFEVPSQNLGLRYRIMAFPGVSGVRTELACMALAECDAGRYPNWLLESYSERLPLETGSMTRHVAGYYNDTQHRYHPDLPILKEAQHRGAIHRCEIHDWASLIALEADGGEGLVLVKESHKCVNQAGVDTGHFKVMPDAVVSTGLGFKAHYSDGAAHFVPRAYRTAWANWCLAYSGGDVGRQLAIKQFDAARYPFLFTRDAMITSNTWGSRGPGAGAQSAANAADVIVELERAARLGIDCVQIDDGWQIDDANLVARREQVWQPDATRFPGGWAAVKKRAAELGVKLGIWFPWWAPLEDMLANIREAGFTQVKLDFLNGLNRTAIDEFMLKARTISALAPDIQINTDLTELEPRAGYYFGRTYCSLFPQNVEMCHEGAMMPRHITYTPHLTLRQTWHYARYMNLNQMQLSTQNIDAIRPDFSDASQHSHAYCFAITLMGLPLFFLETKFYSEAALNELQPVIALYRAHREEILKGIVFPIGEEPDNTAITGFQSHQGESGYITALRELQAPEATSIDTHFLAGKTIVLEDLASGRSQDLVVPASGRIPVVLPTGASWQLLRYALK